MSDEDPRWPESWAGAVAREGASTIPVVEAPEDAASGGPDPAAAVESAHSRLDRNPIECSVRSERWGDTNVLVLDFDPGAWEPNDGMEDTTAHLHGPTFVLNGLPMHMEAWAVTEDENGIQSATWEWADDYDQLAEAVHADRAFSTIKIGDRDYIVIMRPHC